VKVEEAVGGERAEGGKKRAKKCCFFPEKCCINIFMKNIEKC
jgi:hypothetical protein